MSGAMRFSIEQLNPKLRAQARERYIAALGKAREIVRRQDKEAASELPPLAVAQQATDLLLWQFSLAGGIAVPATEYRFHPQRKWRFDIAWPSLRLAVEIEGGIHGGRGRHIRPVGFKLDAEKYNEAAIMGWRVIRVTHGWINGGQALSIIERAYG